MNLNFKNRKRTLSLLLILIPLFLYLPNLAMAQGCNCAPLDFLCQGKCAIESFFNSIFNVAGYILTLIFRIPIFLFAIFGFVIALISILIGWLIIPPIANFFISISLNPEIFGLDLFSPTSPILGTWETVRGFALSLVKIFLLIIGLATILRIAEYGARKTLISLIIAALLVSFSLPIGKEIINLGNSFTKYIGSFFNLGTGGNYIQVENIYKDLFKDLLNHFTNYILKIFTLDGDLEKFFNTYLGIIILISLSYWVFVVISFYVGAIFLGLGITFFVRLVYLICLLVVSPIAFLTAGLRTKEIRHIFAGFLNWDGWWEAFLEWVFIGVVIMIWLGIGVTLLKNLGNIDKNEFLSAFPACSNPKETENLDVVRDCQAAFVAEQMFSFLPVFACAVALHIGIKTSRGMMKEFVEGVIKLGQAAVTAVAIGATAAVTAGVGAAGAAGGGLAGLKAGVITGAKTGFTSGLSTFAKEAKLGEVVPRPVAAWGEEFVAPWARRVGLFGREAAVKYTAEEKRKAEDFVENVYKTQGVEGVEKLAASASEKRLVRDVATGKLIKEGKLRDELIDNPEFQKFLMTPEGSKHLKDALKLRVDLAPQFINPKTNRPFSPEDIIKEMTPADVIKIRPKALLVPEIISAMDARQMDAIIRRGNVAQKDSLRKGYAELVRKEANLTLDASTPESLRQDVYAYQPDIQAAINRLFSSAEAARRAGRIDEAKALEGKARAIYEISQAIDQEKL